MKKETYCLARRKYTKSINPKIVRNKHNRSIMKSVVKKIVKNLDLLKNNKRWDY